MIGCSGDVGVDSGAADCSGAGLSDAPVALLAAGAPMPPAHAHARRCMAFPPRRTPDAYCAQDSAHPTALPDTVHGACMWVAAASFVHVSLAVYDTRWACAPVCTRAYPSCSAPKHAQVSVVTKKESPARTSARSWASRSGVLWQQFPRELAAVDIRM